MYKYKSGQISITDFGQPMGMHLNENNRWVKKAAMIPWNEIEKRYAGLFKSHKGHPAKPLRLALGACMIQAEYGYSDEEITLQIQENAYLQYFCGYETYDDGKPPFDSSSMVYFRKRLTPEILGDSNEMILSRKSTEQLIDRLHTPGENKPRTYRKRAYKDYLALVRCRKPAAKKIRKAIGKQLSYLRRNLESIEKQLQQGKSLTSAEQNRLIVIQKVYEQQKYMYDNRTHSVPDRIVSLSQPWVRPIVRGKAGKPVEFGAKLDISVVDGFTRLEYLSFDAYNEAGTLRQTIEKYRERTGHYPTRVLADKIYRNRDNLNFCKEHGIRLSGPALGRPKKELPDRKQNYIDECERVEVERRFSLAKRKCNLGMVTAKLTDTAFHCIAMSVVVLNLRKLMLSLPDFLKQHFLYFGFFGLSFIQ